MHLARRLGATAAFAVMIGSAEAAERCPAGVGGPPVPRAPPETIQSPALSQEIEVEIGQPVMSTARYNLVVTEYVLASPIVLKLDKKTDNVTVTLPPGSYKATEVGKTDNGADNYVFSASQATFVDNAKGGVVSRSPLLLIRPPNLPRVFWMKRYSAISYDFEGIVGEMKTCLSLDEKGLRREIVYSGKRGTSISLLYREFINDMARPAFTQELSYDLADGDEIGYRGARFKVVKATNTSLQFIALRPIDGAAS